MTDSKNETATELTPEDLDMAVGGAEIEAAGVVKQEEKQKFLKGEEHRKHDIFPREEKAKRE